MTNVVEIEPGRHIKGKRPENSGIPSSDLRFPISISIENAGASTEENERQQPRNTA